MFESGNLSSPKLVPMCIFSILLRYTDENNQLKQDQIIKILELEYGYKVERKTVSRTIQNFKDELDIDIETVPGKGIYIAQRDFEDYEVQFLIDSVLSNPYISAVDSKELINKLSCLSSPSYLKKPRKNVVVLDSALKVDNRDVYFNLDLIDDAIENGMDVSFTYQMDHKLQSTWSSLLTKTPACIVLVGQRYYMTSLKQINNTKYLEYYALDKMKNVNKKERKDGVFRGKISTIEKEKIRKMISNGTTINPFVHERIEFLCSSLIIGEIQSVFGNDAIILENEDFDDYNSILALKYRVILNVNRLLFKQFYYRNMDHIRITFPIDLAEQLRFQLQTAANLNSTHIIKPQISQNDIEAIDDLSLRTKIAIGRPVHIGKFIYKDGVEKSLEWQFIKLADNNGKSALFISKYSIEFMQSGSTDWESSILRKWLNEDFLQVAFSNEEKEVLVKDEFDDAVTILDYEDLYITNNINNLNYIDMTPYAHLKWEKYIKETHVNSNIVCMDENGRADKNSNHITELGMRDRIHLSRIFWGKTPSKEKRNKTEIGAFEEIVTSRNKYFEGYKLCVRPVIRVKI